MSEWVEFNAPPDTIQVKKWQIKSGGMAKEWHETVSFTIPPFRSRPIGLLSFPLFPSSQCIHQSLSITIGLYSSYSVLVRLSCPYLKLLFLGSPASWSVRLLGTDMDPTLSMWTDHNAATWQDIATDVFPLEDAEDIVVQLKFEMRGVRTLAHGWRRLDVIQASCLISSIPYSCR